MGTDTDTDTADRPVLYAAVHNSECVGHSTSLEGAARLISRAAAHPFEALCTAVRTPDRAFPTVWDVNHADATVGHIATVDLAEQRECLEHCYFCRGAWGACRCKRWDDDIVRFVFEGHEITHPHLSIGRIDYVNPVVYYGAAYLVWRMTGNSPTPPPPRSWWSYVHRKDGAQ